MRKIRGNFQYRQYVQFKIISQEDAVVHECRETRRSTMDWSAQTRVAKVRRTEITFSTLCLKQPVTREWKVKEQFAEWRSYHTTAVGGRGICCWQDIFIAHSLWHW